ncbi:hypothetical protein CERSUDRAFT_98296 [Gelatoporia subvermispora B]|uniref:F-box domain-containing protein n=1 Tax=Ceriporiopsis subvermispora (strain B) TaxID=914234 RepID=M2R6E6_CERS8|nr:hypothetical protein CERSUDRAFT_98296 [Gelatoporia subvermispora B]
MSVSPGEYLDQSNWAVNFDIVCYIMEFLPKHTLLPFMSTCRALRTAGVRHLLSLPVRFDSQTDILSFCVFLHRDLAIRPQHIRDIFLDLSWLQDPLAPVLHSLLEALLHARTLHTLGLVVRNDSLMRFPEITTTLASIRSIQGLTLVTDPGEGERGLLSRMCPLAKLALTYVQSPSNCSPLLETHSNTLTELSLRNGILSERLIQFPSLQRLRISYEHRFLDKNILVSTFPNLTDLELVPASSIRAPTHSQLFEWRTQNSVGTASDWLHLASVRGSFTDIYVLGLSCTLERLEIVIDISRIRPMVLHPHATLGESSTLIGIIPEVFRDAPDTLMELDIHLTPDATRVNPAEDYVELCFVCLENNRFSRLRRLHLNFRKPTLQESSWLYIHVPAQTQTFYDQIDAYDLARRTAARVTTLRKLDLRLDGSSMISWTIPCTNGIPTPYLTKWEDL